jgi:hypothetical protein
MNFNQFIQPLIEHIQLNVFYEHLIKDNKHIDSYLINYLESARNLLINTKELNKIQSYLKILLEYSWEKLNTGIWQNVQDIYRYFYAYSCYMDVLVDCLMITTNYQVKCIGNQNFYLIFCLLLVGYCEKM